MDHEFVTSAGKIFLNNKRLLIQDVKFNFWKSAVGEMIIPALFIGWFVICFIDLSRPFSFFASFLFSGVFLVYYFKRLYNAIVRKSYSNYIPVNRIKSFELKPDEFGLETELRLHLRNGRYRSIVFRTLEKQFDPFTELVSCYIAQPQFA